MRAFDVSDQATALLSMTLADLFIALHLDHDTLKEKKLAIAELLYDFGNRWCYVVSQGSGGIDPTDYLRGEK